MMVVEVRGGASALPAEGIGTTYTRRSRREYLRSLAEAPSTAAGQNGAAHCEPLEIVICDGAAGSETRTTPVKAAV